MKNIKDNLGTIVFSVVIFVIVCLAINDIYHRYKVSSSSTEIELQQACKYFDDISLNHLPVKCIIFINK